MEKIEQKYYKLGENIKCLRKSFGLTQRELAKHLGINNDTISKCELGERIPTRDDIVKVAHFFRITESELLYGNFAEKEKRVIDYPILDKNHLSHIFNSRFPIVQSSEAFLNRKFKEAYFLHEKFMNDIKKQSTEVESYEEYIEYFLALYEQAEEEGVIEATANILSFFLLYGFLLSYINDTTIEFSEKLISGQIDVKQFFEEIYLLKNNENEKQFKESQNRKKAFVDEYGVTEILFRIYKLKRHYQYCDLGDFFLARMYQLDLSPTFQTSEMNRLIGEEIGNVFYVMGNQYFH